jgi:NADP-dependent 3-hydroxy acid dehydrogenase YdfG
MKTIAVIGAGPGLGCSVAERFGREGFRAGLISRSQEHLDALVKRCEAAGVESAGFAADVLDRDSLQAAIGQIRDAFGPIDVMEYSPTPTPDTVTHILDTTPASAEFHVAYALLGGIAAVNATLPEMLERGDGALLFTTGASASNPMPSHGSAGLGLGALRNYAYALNAALVDKGVYAGTLMLATLIAKGTEADPDTLADVIWDMCSQRDRVEVVVGSVERLLEMERALSGDRAQSVELDSLIRANQ